MALPSLSPKLLVDQWLRSSSPDLTRSITGVTTPDSITSEDEDAYDKDADGYGLQEQVRFEIKPKVWCIDSEINTSAPQDKPTIKTLEEKGRELTPWLPSPELGQVLDESLDDMAKRKSVQGDQFLVNKELFGVVSTYKEDLSQYTTPLDISAVPIAIREKAGRLAREIERDGKRSSHDPEIADIDNDADEEALWSAVKRDLGHIESRSTTSECATRDCSRPDASASLGVDLQLPAPTVRGTFVHVDGVGIVDEFTVKSMPWLLQQSSWQQAPLQSYAVPTSQVSCEAGDRIVGQWCGTQMLSTSQVSCDVATAVSTQACLPPGTEVVIGGLVKAPAFNGLHGIVDSFDHEAGRYTVRLQTSTQENQLAKLKIENLCWNADQTGRPLPSYQ